MVALSSGRGVFLPVGDWGWGLVLERLRDWYPSMEVTLISSGLTDGRGIRTGRSRRQTGEPAKPCGSGRHARATSSPCQRRMLFSSTVDAPVPVSQLGVRYSWTHATLSLLADCLGFYPEAPVLAYRGLGLSVLWLSGPAWDHNHLSCLGITPWLFPGTSIRRR